jgi:septal ring factor EnvC (AmiA/AmiB activator)
MDAAWIALIGTVFGGVGLKVVDHYLSKNKVKIDDAARIRDELRIEITNLREEVQKLEAERDKWREDYWSLREQIADLHTQITLLKQLKNPSGESS